MQNSLREQLIASRPQATAYAEELRAIVPNIKGTTGYIGGIAMAIVKSLGMLDVNKALITPQGLRTDDNAFGDRAAMIALRKPGTLKDGTPFGHVRFSQREAGKLNQARPYHDDMADQLVYEHPQVAAPLVITPNQLAPREADPNDPQTTVNVKMFKDKDDIFPGILENGPITAWVRELLAATATGKEKYNIDDIHVLLQPKNLDRPVDEMHRRGQEQAKTGFTDGGQILVASEETLRWMNQDLRQKKQRAMDIEALRPNLVLNGHLPPNIEDIIDSILIGTHTREQIRLLFGELSVRCDVTRVDQQTGEKPDAQPLLWLSQNRPARHDKPNSTTFGVNAVFPESANDKIIATFMPFTILGEK